MLGARVRTAIPVMLASFLLLGAAACSSSSKSSSSGSSTTAPEDVRAPAAEVAAGLKQLQTTAAEVAAAVVGTDKAKARSAVDQIEPVWKKVDSTVKANDSDAYVTFEDNFALLKKAADSGEAAQAQQAASGVSQTVASYLAKHPG